MATYKDILLLVDKVSAPLQKIQNSMKKTTEQTNKLTEKLKRFNDKMKDLTPTSNKVLSLTGKLTKSFIGLVGASGAITAGINKVAEYGDRIDKLSQKIGMSSQAFQEWDYILSQNGGEIESLQMGFRTLTNQLSMAGKGTKDSIAMFKRLGVNIKDNAGNLRKQDDVFNDTIRALQKMGETTERDAIASKLLGRSFIELKPLLNQSAESVDKLREKANKMGLIMSKEDIENARDFKDTMDTLSRFFQSNFNKALSKVLPQLTEILNKIMELKEPIMAIIKLLGNVAVITLKIFGFLAKHWEILVGIGTALAVISAPAMITGIVALGTAFAALNLPLIGIGLAVGAIITAIVALVKNWKTVWNTIKSITSSVVNGILGFINKLLDKLGFLAYLIPGLGQIKLGKDIASAVGSKINNSRVNQTQNNNSTSNVYNTTNNYGNTNTYNGMFGLTQPSYVPVRP